MANRKSFKREKMHLQKRISSGEREREREREREKWSIFHKKKWCLVQWFDLVILGLS